MLRFHYPNIKMIVLDESSENVQTKKVNVKYLLPYPYYKLREKENDALVPLQWCCKGHNIEFNSN